MFSNYIRFFINFYKVIIFLSFDDLEIEIFLKNKVGENYEVDI